MSIETRALSTVDGVGKGPTARSISYSPSPYVSATNVQAALDTLGVNYALTQSYAQSASASADTATSAASSAQGYATAAAASAGSAATQASSAAASAATATSQASAASASATSANSSKTAAEAAATSAQGYLASAQASATAAANSETAASGYASAASASATAAAGSASAASTSATNASTSATNASNSASAASTSATNAANSASAASTSATNAANSASAASTSATNAATSETNASGYAASAAASAALAASYTLGWTGTSTTSVAIGTGSKSFTASTGKLWVAGTPLLISSNANTNNFMFGIVTAYVSGTGALTVNVTTIGGSGTLSDWNISLSGQKGVDGLGTGDVLGPGTNSNGWIPTWNGANSKTLANGIDPATLLTTAAAAAGYQPLDSDLTAIAALTTATYGRSLLTLANAAALAAEVDPYFLTPAEGNAAYQPLDADLTAVAALTTTTYGRSLLTLADAAAGRTTLGLATIASSGSASDLSAGTVPAARMPAHTGDVTSSAGSVALTIGNATVTYAKIQNVSATDKLLGRATAGAGSVEEITCTPFARTILDDADAATARSTLGAQASLGFTPVQQGGGAGQGANKLYFGWDGANIRVQVDAADIGKLLSGANNLSDVSNAATARSNIGAAPTNDPTFTGTITLPTAFGINSIAAGTGDGASFTTYNVKFQSWWGIGFSAYDSTVRAVLNTRDGTWNVLGGYQVNGASVYYSGGTDVPVSDGGTGASDAATARSNLGLGSISTFAESTAAEYRQNTSGKALSTDKVWSAASTHATLTDAATVTPDFNYFDHDWTIGATGRTLANPTNIKVGQRGTIHITQDGGGSKTITTYGSYYKFPGGVKPTLSVAAGARDRITYEVVSSTQIDCFFAGAMS